MIGVIGGTGFLGTPVAHAVAIRGERVRVLARNAVKTRTRSGTCVDATANIEVVGGDMHDAEALDRLLTGARTAYVLVQTVTGRQAAGTGDFVQAERAGLAAIVESSRRQGVGRLLTVGLIGATSDARNAWVRARAHNDQYLLSSGLDVTIPRGGLIAGIGSVAFDAVLAAAGKDVAAIRGTGRQRWSYIALEDLVGYLVAALDEPRAYGRPFDVGSTETPTYRELIARTSAALSRPAPLIILSIGLAETFRPRDRTPATPAAGRRPRRRRPPGRRPGRQLTTRPIRPARAPPRLGGRPAPHRPGGQVVSRPTPPSPDLATPSRSRKRQRKS